MRPRPSIASPHAGLGGEMSSGDHRPGQMGGDPVERGTGRGPVTRLDGAEGALTPAFLLFIVVAAMGIMLFMRVGEATVIGAEATVAADAAALAGVDALRSSNPGVGPVAALMATGRIPDGLRDAAHSAAADYAARNDAQLLPGSRLEKVPDQPAVRYTARVQSTRDLDGDRPVRVAVAELRFSVVAPGAGSCMSPAEVDSLLVPAGVDGDHNGVSGLATCHGTDTQNLDPEFKLAFLRAEAAMKDHEGNDNAYIVLSSAYRSAMRQAELYADYQACRAGGGVDCTPAAPPGASLHNYGRAIDLPGGQWQRLRDALASSSFTPLSPCPPNANVIWPDIDNDPYHFQDCRGRPVGLPNGNAFGLLEFEDAHLVE